MENVIRTIKLPLCKITRNSHYDYLISNLSDCLYRTQIISTNTCDFIRLYLSFLFEEDLQFDKIDRQFMVTVNSLVSEKSKFGKKSQSEIKGALIEFYNDYYSLTSPKLVSRTNLSNILDYEADNYIAHLETNIKEHYYDHVIKLIKIYFEFDDKLKKLKLIKEDDKRKKDISIFYEEFNQIRDDIFSISNKFPLKSKILHHDWIKKIRPLIIPKKKSYVKNSIPYDVCCDPQSYLKQMFAINNEFNKMSTKENQIKLFNVTPLRTTYIPPHIMLDTASLINILCTENVAKKLKQITEIKDEVWGTYFKIDTTKFKKKGYKFNYCISTDGVSCSLVFEKIGIDGKSIKIKKSENKENEIYIEDNVKNINDKENVVVDPNCGNLIYAEGKNGKYFRYTRKQRNQESCTKKYTEIREKLNETKVIGNVTITELQNNLSNYNSKSINVKELTTYLKIRYLRQMTLYKHYRKRIFRKFKLNVYTNIQKSESKLIKNFGKKFGNSEKVQVIWGDYDNDGKHIKNKEPIVTKRLRKLFRKNGYTVYLINEFRTSKTCNICKKDTENFHKRKKGDFLVWGLLRCQNLKCISETQNGKKCRRYFNRDKNSCKNMLTIIQELKKTGKRPAIFCKEIRKPIIIESIKDEKKNSIIDDENEERLIKKKKN